MDMYIEKIKKLNNRIINLPIYSFLIFCYNMSILFLSIN